MTPNDRQNKRKTSLVQSVNDSPARSCDKIHNQQKIFLVIKNTDYLPT